MNIHILLIFSLFSVCLWAESDNSFSYKGTVNQSMSKFQRIGHIEEYLGSLNSKMQNFAGSIEREGKKIESNLKRDLSGLENSLNSLKREISIIKDKDIPAIKELVNNNDKNGDLAKKVEAQKVEIDELKNEILSLQTVLKSLVKSRQAQAELNKRGAPSINKKKSP